MQKRGNIAVFLVVLFIAAVGLFTAFSGSGATGMFGVPISWWDTPSNLPAVCGKLCLRQNDCADPCPYCSPSFGRCIGNKNYVFSGRYSWSNYNLCIRRCNMVNQRCNIGARNAASRATCASNLPLCTQSCNVTSVPNNQAALILPYG